MLKLARYALLPIALLQFLVPLGARFGIGETMAVRAVEDGVPPELPPGIFFAIWGVIFIGYLSVAVNALRQPDTISYPVAAALAAAGLGNIIWMISAQMLGWSWLDFLLLIPILIMAWEAAQRLDRMPPPAHWTGQVTLMVAGLLSGWLTVAVSISVPDVVRWALGWAVSDNVWYSLWLALVPAGLLAWLFASRFSKTWWFFVALGWGLIGIIANNWLRTEAHALAIATTIVGLYVFRRRLRFGARGSGTSEAL